MIVGFDGNEANVPERVGVNQYAFDILHALHEFVKKEGKPIKIVVYLKNPPQKKTFQKQISILNTRYCREGLCGS